MSISETAVIHDGVIIEEDVIIHDYVVIYPNVWIKKGAEIFDHCTVGKKPVAPGCTSRKTNRDYQQTIIGEDTILSPGCVVYSGTTVGDHTLLGDNCSILDECRVGDYCVISRNVSINYNTVIGNRTKIMDNTHITGNAIIEEDVFISVLVATTNDNTMGKKGYTNDMKGPHIKKNAKIGAAANLLPGVIIGENSIVGASALVTKDVADHKLVMGIPARVIRNVD